MISRRDLPLSSCPSSSLGMRLPAKLQLCRHGKRGSFALAVHPAKQSFKDNGITKLELGNEDESILFCVFCAFLRLVPLLDLASITAGVTLLATLLPCLVQAGTPRSRLLVEEGFESGNLSFHVSGNAPEVLRVSDARAGKFVMRSELNPSSKVPFRTEVAISEKIANFDVGKDYWVGVSTKLGEGFRDKSTFNDQGIFVQWHYRDKLHPEVRDAQPLLLRFRDGKVHVHNEVLQTYMASVPPAYGKWVDWVMHVRFSDKDGVIQVWRNGSQIVDWRGSNHQPEKSEGAYLKLGLYSAQYKTKSLQSDFKRVVYHDELRIAGADGSYELVAPRGKASP